MRTAIAWEQLGRPTRAVAIVPHNTRERLAAWLGRSLLERWDRELAAETMRANAMTEDLVAERGRPRVKDAPVA
jgi:hypothetical protein